MPGEVGQVVEEISDEEAEAAFASGFNPEVQTTSPDATVVDTPAPAPAPVDAPAAPEPPKLAQITEDQFQQLLTSATAIDTIKAELKQAKDGLAGQVGGLKQKIEQFQQATPAGQAVDITDEDFAELKADFPELSTSTIAGLKRVFAKLKGTGAPAPAFDSSELEGSINKRFESLRDIELDREFGGDWKAGVKSDNWKQWVEKLPGYNAVINDRQALSAAMADPSSSISQWLKANPSEPFALLLSDNPRDAARLFRAYGQSKTATPPPPNPAPNVRKQQLSAAVNPKSAGAVSTAKTDDDEFSSGFKTEYRAPS